MTSRLHRLVTRVSGQGVLGGGRVAFPGCVVGDPLKALGNLVLNLDASVEESVTLDGSGGVSLWADQSGQNLHFGQESAGARCTYTSGVGVHSDGTQRLLRAHTELLAPPGGLTILAVASADNVGDFNILIGKDFQYRFFLWHGTHNRTRLESWDTSAQRGTNAPVAAVRDGNRHTLGMRVDDGTDIRARVDGEDGSPSSFGEADTDTREIVIFARNDSGQWPLTGTIHQLIAYSGALPLDKVVEAEAILADKWDVTL
jgi:hypothetical protein